MRTLNLKKWVLLGLVLISMQSFAGRDQFNEISPNDQPNAQIDTNCPIRMLSKDALGLVLGHLDLSDSLKARETCLAFDFVGTARWDAAKDRAFRELEAQFIPIPAGQLPGGTQIPAFETIAAVDRQTWEAFMGKPKDFPKDKGGNWKWENCPKCPVTHVAWEENEATGYQAAEVQKFIQRYNAEAKRHPEMIPPGKEECTYSAGSEDQRLYAHLGDPTGTNHVYMLGKDGVEVTEENAGKYFWHRKNSENQIQPLGTKEKNAFGLEWPSVWIMTEDENADDRRLGRAMRGGSWMYPVDYARSDRLVSAGTGGRAGTVGFSLVRTCH